MRSSEGPEAGGFSTELAALAPEQLVPAEAIVLDRHDGPARASFAFPGDASRTRADATVAVLSPNRMSGAITSSAHGHLVASATGNQCLRHDGGVKRSTAIRHLVELAGEASEGLGLRETDIGWPLEELWVGGDLLGLADSLELGSVTLVLDVPAEELPWLARHPVGEWVGRQIGLGKRSMQWFYRPLAWPVWNHEHRRLVRFWSAADGTDGDVIEALRSRHLDELRVSVPSDGELARQMAAELDVSQQHLRAMLDRYWDRDWRRDHGRFDESPEDHLWRAATAVTEIQDALDELQS